MCRLISAVSAKISGSESSRATCTGTTPRNGDAESFAELSQKDPENQFD
jgi:hypothetical protein